MTNLIDYNIVEYILTHKRKPEYSPFNLNGLIYSIQNGCGTIQVSLDICHDIENNGLLNQLCCML